MATSIRPDHSDGGDTPDPTETFINSVAAKYEKEDAAAGVKPGGDEDGEDAPADDADEEDDAPDANEGTEDHTDEDTPDDDPDGDAPESGEESTDDDEDEHPNGDKPDDSPNDDDADDEPEAGEDEDEDEPATDATKAALAARGADLKLEDVPAEYQGIVKSKLKSMDAAFTRVLQDATAFRAERTQFEADRRFREENPEFALTEAIQAALAKDPDIFDKINARFEKLEDPDQRAAFEIVLKNKRAEAVQAVQTEHGKLEQRFARADFVEKTAKDLAVKAGLPWRLAERAVVLALKDKGDGPDLTDEELTAVIAEEAREYTKETRAQRRTASKEIVKNRTANRSSSAPPAKRPAAAAPPRPAGKKAPEVDFNSEESRHKAMMATAKRVLPGTRDE